MDACNITSGGQAGYCECTLNELEATGKDEGDITASDMAAAASKCQ